MRILKSFFLVCALFSLSCACHARSTINITSAGYYHPAGVFLGDVIDEVMDCNGKISCHINLGSRGMGEKYSHMDLRISYFCQNDSGMKTTDSTPELFIPGTPAKDTMFISCFAVTDQEEHHSIKGLGILSSLSFLSAEIRRTIMGKAGYKQVKTGKVD